MLEFHELGHKYLNSINGEEYISVTKVIEKLHESFDSESMAKKCSKNSKSKWYGMAPDKIIRIWNSENKRSTELGHYYHKIQEDNAADANLKVFRSDVRQGVKYATNQILEEGLYVEHLIYHPTVNLCGQADEVRVEDGYIHILDYKTSKEIKMKGFTPYNGKPKMLFYPVDHMEDCNYNHYTLQLSLYMYMILLHNPHLKPGKICIRHSIFNERLDQYGFPKTIFNEGVPSIKTLMWYWPEYHEKEVIKIINYLFN